MPNFNGDDAADKRRERRFEATLPVMLEGFEWVVTAFTRDVSASGMYCETEASLEPGATFGLTVEIETSNGKRILSGRGIVIRVDSVNNRFGCAIKILDSHLLS